MNILHVIDTLNIGGAERVLVTLCNIFRQRKHEIDVLTILTPGKYAEELLPGIKVYSLNRKWKFNPLKLYKLSRIVNRYDIVHIHMRYDLRYVFLSKLLFGFKTKIVSHDHYGDILIDPAIPKFSKFILKRVTYAAVSRDLIEWAVNKVGLPREETFLLSNIVQIKNNIPTRSNVKPHSILMVANIRPAKNIEFALELMRAFREKGSPYTLDIVGQINDTEYYKKILEMMDQYQLDKSVKLIHDCYDVQAIVPDYSLAIHTAKSESGPLVLIEYLGLSIPFVAYKTGRVVEQIGNELPELICSTFKVEEWMSSIDSLLNENEMGINQRLKPRMKEVFIKYYSEDNYYKDCLTVYERALKKSK
ncbi:MAG TPA: glycosyltransferase [Chryseolinea sp.]|nr:glycosyltransferase [Chryseolinea sp.]